MQSCAMLKCFYLFIHSSLQFSPGQMSQGGTEDVSLNKLFRARQGSHLPTSTQRRRPTLVRSARDSGKSGSQIVRLSDKEWRHGTLLLHI